MSSISIHHTRRVCHAPAAHLPLPVKKGMSLDAAVDRLANHGLSGSQKKIISTILTNSGFGNGFINQNNFEYFFFKLCVHFSTNPKRVIRARKGDCGVLPAVIGRICEPNGQTLKIGSPLQSAYRALIGFSIMLIEQRGDGGCFSKRDYNRYCRFINIPPLHYFAPYSLIGVHLANDAQIPVRNKEAWIANPFCRLDAAAHSFPNTISPQACREFAQSSASLENIYNNGRTLQLILFFERTGDWILPSLAKLFAASSDPDRLILAHKLMTPAELTLLAVLLKKTPHSLPSKFIL